MDESPYKPVNTFPSGIKVCFSMKSDGSVAVGGGSEPTDENKRNAKQFLDRYNFSLPSTKLFVTYGSDRTYTDVFRVTKNDAGQLLAVDALYTTEKNLTITLPVGDCVATVVYDPTIQLVGVLHLGRHASVERLIEAFAYEVSSTTGSQPADWHVWMSPSLQVAENRLEYFYPPYDEEWDEFRSLDLDNMIHIDIPAHNRDRFIRLGVLPERIVVSSIDTYTDERYFSHRAAIELSDETRQGRMMVAAIMAV